MKNSCFAHICENSIIQRKCSFFDLFEKIISKKISKKWTLFGDHFEKIFFQRIEKKNVFLRKSLFAHISENIFQYFERVALEEIAHITENINISRKIPSFRFLWKIVCYVQKKISRKWTVFEITLKKSFLDHFFKNVNVYSKIDVFLGSLWKIVFCPYLRKY